MINLIIMARCLKPVYNEHPFKNNFLKGVIAISARRSLEKEQIDSLVKLSNYSEKELLNFLNLDKSTISKLKNYMAENSFYFKDFLSLFLILSGTKI